jgi:hypothetical protein
VSIQYNSHATFEVFMEMTLLLLAAGWSEDGGTTRCHNAENDL